MGDTGEGQTVEKSGRKKLRYEKLDPITHIHRRTDMYIGNPLPAVHAAEWLVDPQTLLVVRETSPEYSDGLLRILIEPLSNMIDNAWRSREAGVRCSRFMIRMTTDHVEFWNDGLGIPVQLHQQADPEHPETPNPTEGSHAISTVYVPELIFGNLLTGTNYDDAEDRLTSGRNGIGVKLSNVFSTRFEIEVYDAESHRLYTQSWSDSMRVKTAPVIRKRSSPKTSYTKIAFWPEFSRFGGSAWGSTLMRLMHRIACDTAALTGIPVHWSSPLGSSEDSEKIQFRTLREYIQKRFPVNPTEIMDIQLDLGRGQKIDAVIGTTESPDCIELGYVNGIYNREGGVHVDSLAGEFFRQLHARLARSRKDFPLTVKDLRPHFLIVVHATLINPSFTNQNKTRLVAPTPKIVLDPKWAHQVGARWVGVRERVEDLLRQKDILSLKKSENKKRQRSVVRIEGLDAANLAGTARSSECTLILCEGLSAKTYAVAGIQIGWRGHKGRDYFGIYPLRGKLLNCRNASVAVISQNKEVTDLIQALNLRHGVDYGIPENRRQLHYGRILILTDSDVDGLHISSLILNAFHCLFPTLCRPEEPFLYWMMTPVAKIHCGRGSGASVQTFFNDFEYQRALETLPEPPTKIKYFKGLGTSSNHEVGETFGQKVVSFHWDDRSGDALVRAFSSTMANERKKWMEMHDPTRYRVPEETYPVTEFLDQELVRYSIDDCQRSLPCLVDGLKQSHRKILYAVFKKNLVAHSMKVAQLAGYVAEVSNYHHGEQCLYDTVTKMAHTFVGSNNLPYLYRDGQFGSRTYLGKDAANARYIFTRLETLTRLLFSALDEPLLHHTMDDGDLVEPDFYVPLLPMILVNGCVAGIGTGWSCSVPCFHPIRLVRAVRLWLQGDSDYAVDTWTPWYRGFTGRIYSTRPKVFVTEGVLDLPGTWIPEAGRHDPNTKKTRRRTDGGGERAYRVREIPIKESINRYKEFLEKLQEEKKIKNLLNYSSADAPYFVFEATDLDAFEPTLDSLRLRGEISVANMVLFQEDGRLRKFDTVQEIFEAFCSTRLQFYEKRKAYLLRQWEDELRQKQNRLRFLREVADDTLKIFRVPEDEIVHQLRERGYDTVEDSYEYLLSIRIRQFSGSQWQELERQIQRLQKDIQILRDSPPSRLWLDELDAFLKAYKKIYPEDEDA